MIMKHIIKIFVVLVTLIACTGCFKEEKQGTRMRIALYSQKEDKGDITKTTYDIEAYAFWVPKNTDWEVQSWEDAIDRRITNIDKPGEVLTIPDEEATYDIEADYQLTFELWTTHAFLVIVDKTNKIYATRLYETPMNLPEVYVQLHIYEWRASGTANGWDVVKVTEDSETE